MVAGFQSPFTGSGPVSNLQGLRKLVHGHGLVLASGTGTAVVRLPGREVTEEKGVRGVTLHALVP